MPSLSPCTPATTRANVEPHGYVHVSGRFVNTHRPDLEALLVREERRAHRISPDARVLTWDDDGSGGLLLSTSTEHLAHRLGRSLEKAFGGELHHGFSHNNKLAFVWWRR